MKRRRKAKTPVLDKAEKNHGKEVRETARKKRRKQAKVDADVEVAEAALEGDFSSSSEQSDTETKFAARTGDDKFAPDANGKEPVLAVNLQATLEDGTAAKKNDLITDEAGNVFWGRLPELPELKEKGFDALDIILRLGAKSDGFSHIVTKHGQWIMDAMGIDDPILACKRFIAEVLSNVQKIQYQSNKGRDNLLLKEGPSARYFIVVVGRDRVEPEYSSIKTAFVADRSDRFDTEATLYEGGDALELRIPMSSFGENQRLRVASEQQDRSSDYPVAAASVPSEDTLPQVGSIVKSESVEPYRKPDAADASMSVTDAQERGLLPWEDYEDTDASFNVVGENAANWEKIKHLAFRGRDDGKLRVELDASQANVSDKAFESRVYQAFESLVQAGYDETLAEEDGRALAEYAAALREYRALELEVLNRGTEDMELWKKMRDSREASKALRDAAYDVLERWCVKHGGPRASVRNIPMDVKDRMVEDFMAGRVSEQTWKNLNGERRQSVVYLGDVLDFPELYEAYPELKQLAVWAEDLGLFMRGRLIVDGFGGFTISLNEALLDDVLQMRSTLLHEVQHWIQYKENFAKGGNETMAENLVSTGMAERQQQIQQVKDELDWLNGIDFAKEQLQRIRRILLRPRAILKMSERWAVHEVQNVDVMAAEAVDMMWDEYAQMQRSDAALARRFASGLGKMLPVRNAEKASLHAVEQLLDEIEKMKSRKVANKGRKGELLRQLDDIYGTYQQFAKLDGLNGYALYQRLAGEIEARNVQLRRDWTAEERAARPFNETLEYPGEALVSFSVSDTLMEDIRRAAYNKIDSREHIHLCTMPTVLRMMGEPDGDVYTLPGTISKLVYTHNLAHPEVYRAVEELDDPLFVFKDTANSYLFVLEMQATNNKGVKSNVAVAIQMKRSESGHYLLSAYPLDALDKIVSQSEQKHLVYSKYTDSELNALLNKQATPPTDGASVFFQSALVRSAVKGGLTPTVKTKSDLVKYKVRDAGDFSIAVQKAF